MAVSEFRHEVMFYDSPEGFLAGTVPFIAAALEADEAALVAATAEKIELLKGELGPAATERVRFTGIEELARNPARIIPAWRQFIDEHAAAGRPARGIGEPIWPGRGADEVDECQRHESLLNIAFAGAPAWSLLCPYDLHSLEDEVLEVAAHSHPYLAAAGGSRANGQCRELESPPDPFAGSFAPAPSSAGELAFDRDGLHDLRQRVGAAAANAGLSRERASDLVLAANELAANSVRHGGGSGTARFWREREALVVEVTDAGRIEQPLVGRVRPAPTENAGRGLWMANQVCDLVRIRSGEDGTAVRLHMALG